MKNILRALATATTTGVKGDDRGQNGEGYEDSESEEEDVEFRHALGRVKEETHGILDRRQGVIDRSQEEFDRSLDGEESSQEKE